MNSENAQTTAEMNASSVKASKLKVAEQLEIRRLVDVVGDRGAHGEAGIPVGGLVDDGREGRRGDDPDEQVPADSASAQRDREEEVETGREAAAILWL
jgi:hypothetical protein